MTGRPRRRRTILADHPGWVAWLVRVTTALTVYVIASVVADAAGGEGWRLKWLGLGILVGAVAEAGVWRGRGRGSRR
jgi:hypothetical protein